MHLLVVQKYVTHTKKYNCSDGHPYIPVFNIKAHATKVYMTERKIWCSYGCAGDEY